MGGKKIAGTRPKSCIVPKKTSATTRHREPRPAHGGQQQPAVAPVEPRVVAVALRRLLHLEKQHAEQRDHRQRQEPRAQERDRHHLKERRRVLTDRRLGEVDRQEGGRRRQRRHQERRLELRRGRDRGLLHRLALGHLNHDRFGHHDGVVDQQAERDDQRGQRHRVDADVEERHEDEAHDDGHRNQAGDDQTGAKSEAHQHDQHHDRHRLHQVAGEVARPSSRPRRPGTG